MILLPSLCESAILDPFKVRLSVEGQHRTTKSSETYGMKKVVLGLSIGLLLGIVLARFDWGTLLPFSNTTYGISCPDLQSYELHYFGTEIPPFSSRHFFFRSGFGDVDEYWSFVLPPDQARDFIDTYITENNLLPATSETAFPSGVDITYEHEDWKRDLWFTSFSDLSEIYLAEGLFCAYSQEKNRVYLMNWNE
jgi:hypothetical protein